MFQSLSLCVCVYECVRECLVCVCVSVSEFEFVCLCLSV